MLVELFTSVGSGERFREMNHECESFFIGLGKIKNSHMIEQYHELNLNNHVYLS